MKNFNTFYTFDAATVDTALESARTKAREASAAIENNESPEEVRAAIGRALEASRAARAMFAARYNIR